MIPDNDLTLETRILSLLDGSITETEFHHLEDELSANPEARQIYYQLVAIHQGLEFRLSRSNPATGAVGLAESRLQRQRTKSLRFAVISAAALLLITLITMRMFFVETKTSNPSLDFDTAPGTLFTLTHDENSDVSDGLQLDVESRLQISQGSVELKFSSGVRAIVQGPADITLHDHDQLYMDRGTAWFHVPKNARGFTVLTRELRIIDLGTKFGVISDPEKNDEVHVFQGKVEVHALHGVMKETTLTTSEATLVHPYGRFDDTKLDPSQFQVKLPKTLPHLHLAFDNSSELVKSNTLSDAQDLQCFLHGSANPSTANLFEPGKFGNAIALDGITSYIETDWPGILGNNPRTVAFWLKMPPRRKTENIQPFTGTVIGWGTQQSGISSNINSKWTIHFDYREAVHPMLHISFGGFWYYAPETILDDNEWHHIAVTYSGTSNAEGLPLTRLYVDGQPQDTQLTPTGILNLNEDDQVIIETMDHTPLVVGANLSRDWKQFVEPGKYLQAQIDELYIIKGVIDEYSVRQLMEDNKLTHAPLE